MRSARNRLAAAAAALPLLWAGVAGAAESCREWRDEHGYWKVQAARRALGAAPRHELDTAVFELLQREAYLTSCEVSVRGARADLVGWRLLGRAPDEYGSAVLESLLERGGFDLDLRRLFAAAPPPASAARRDRRSGYRASAVGLGLAALAAAPLLALASAGRVPGELGPALLAGLLGALDAVGWVLLPQLVLAAAIGSLALQQLVSRAAGGSAAPAPGWLDPAVESALLLGLLGTIQGMISGFIGVSPEELQPGPLVHSLGVALRSSGVGFAIALVGVWTKARRPTESADAQRAERERRPEPERASARSGKT